MSGQEIPPWLREQLARYEQMQQNLQAILAQKQQVEVELAEVDRALKELGKVKGKAAVYKLIGPLLIKADKEAIVKELEERRELANTRMVVLNRQESRLRDGIKDLQNKINEAIRGRPPATGS